MKNVVILSNDHAYTYNFRKEIIQKLIERGYRVHIVLPYGEKVELLKEMGCEFFNLPLDRRGSNPIADVKLAFNYFKIIKKINPDVVLSYTVKPNIYGGMACRLLNIPFIANVTGLGTAVANKSFMQRMILQLYRVAFKKISCIFFQNSENQQFFVQQKLGLGKHRIIPGSGVDLNKYRIEDYPENDGIVQFLFIGRIMKDKGIEELIKAAVVIKRNHKNVKFDVIGPYEDKYKERAAELERLDVVKFHGIKDNVHDYIKKCNAVILPSYHEGMANVLLESASTGRPVLASNVAGCKETFDEGISGFGFEVKSVDSLVGAIIKFINLPYNQKKEMGIAGRKKMEREFDRNIVVEAYMEEMDRIKR